MHFIKIVCYESKEKCTIIGFLFYQFKFFLTFELLMEKKFSVVNIKKIIFFQFEIGYIVNVNINST